MYFLFLLDKNSFIFVPINANLLTINIVYFRGSEVSLISKQ